MQGGPSAIVAVAALRRGCWIFPARSRDPAREILPRLAQSPRAELAV